MRRPFRSLVNNKSLLITFSVVIGFLLGSLAGIKVNAGPSSSVLPIEKGGTGNNIGNAQSADKLMTPRLINDALFDGTTNVLVGNASGRIELSSSDSPTYIKFYNRRNTEASAIQVISAACINNSFSLTFYQKPNEIPFVTNAYINKSARDSLTNNCIQYNVNTSNNELYLKITQVDANRLFYWSDLMSTTLAVRVTDASERAALAAKAWRNFNFIEGDSSETPM
jgi:hypothetical protein